MNIRAADEHDVDAMSDVLLDIVPTGRRTSPCDPDFVRDTYIESPLRVRCSVAVDDDGKVLGFQSLRRSDGDNPYGTVAGLGIIGTHIRPSAARRGVGRALFAASLAAARAAGLVHIEAYIAADNPEALGYYGAVGFVTCREPSGAVVKTYEVDV